MGAKDIVLNLGNGSTYPLRFGAMGAYLLQKELSMSIQEFGALVDENRLGFVELHTLLWAELESARKKNPMSHPLPWTIESVGDLIDGTCDGDLLEFWKQFGPAVTDAFKQSFHLTMAAQEALQRRMAQAAQRPSQEDGADRPTHAAASTGDHPSSGTTSSTMPPASRSRRTRSGG